MIKNDNTIYIFQTRPTTKKQLARSQFDDENKQKYSIHIKNIFQDEITNLNY